MKPYRPNVKLAKELYSLRLSLEWMRKRRGRPGAGKANREQQRTLDRKSADA